MGQPRNVVRELFHTLVQSARNAKAIALGRLTIVPLSLSSQPKAEFLLMDRALKHGQVEFGELGHSEVNRIRATNRTKVPVLVLPGMVLEGAWQDRTATRPFVLPAGYSGPIPVFCVERHRWGGGRRFARSAGSVDSLLLSQLKAGREEQHLLWEKIGGRMRRAHIATETQTYRDLLSSREHRMLAERLAERVRLPREANGFALFLDGKLVHLELLPIHEAAAQTFTERLRATAVNLVDLETLRELEREEEVTGEDKGSESPVDELREKLSGLLGKLAELEPELEESEVGNLAKLRNERGDYAEVVVWQGMPLYIYATSGEAVELAEEIDQKYLELLGNGLQERLPRITGIAQLDEVLVITEQLRQSIRHLERRSPTHPTSLSISLPYEAVDLYANLIGLLELAHRALPPLPPRKPIRSYAQITLREIEERFSQADHLLTRTREPAERLLKKLEGLPEENQAAVEVISWVRRALLNIDRTLRLLRDLRGPLFELINRLGENRPLGELAEAAREQEPDERRTISQEELANLRRRVVERLVEQVEQVA